MTSVVIALFVIALLVSAAYAVLARGISPLGPVRRAGVRGASRRRDPQVNPPPAPRRDALPAVQELAWVLRSQQWEPRSENPELAELSAHMNHGYYHRCKVCTGDAHAMAAAIHHVLTARAEIDAEVQR